MANKALRKRKQVERMVRIPGPLYVKFKDYAVSQNRSVNAELIVAMEEHLDKAPQHEKEIPNDG